MISPGNYKLPTNFEELKKIVYRDKHDPSLKSKKRESGIFIQPSKELLEICNNIVKNFDTTLKWSFEIFYSTSPVKLHNDANCNRDLKRCHRVMIIPIDYSMPIKPSTIVFDKLCETKILAGSRTGTYVDLTNKIVDINIEDTNFIDPEYYKLKLKHMPVDFYKGLKVLKDQTWNMGDFYIIDSRYLHASGFFKDTDWKLSINGLGFKYD
jgi:hypothetical protein